MSAWHIGVIGGSGLAEGLGLENAQDIAVESPFGAPSGPVTTGTLEGVRFTFLARHGAGHAIPPSSVNYRANIDALKRCGVTDLVALSAVGSLAETYAPGQMVVVDQMIDHTRGRERSFFGPGLVAHVSLADPTCPRPCRRDRPPTRHLYRHRRPAIFHPRRKRDVSIMGRGRYRHDRLSRGASRA